MKKIIWIISIALIALWISGCDDNDENSNVEVINPSELPYNVEIDPTNFETTDISGNSYFPLIEGNTYVYEGVDEDGSTVRVEDKISTNTKQIMGVTCVVVENREWISGELVEETYDWYGQDLSGNVWYFGEDSNDIENGEVVSNSGSWEAGVDGALPGIIMLAEPQPGMWYRQEYYENEAEDVANILGYISNLSVPYGSYQNVLQIAEWTPLEPDVLEYKYFAAGIGMLRAEAVEGDSGYEELTEIISE